MAFYLNVRAWRNAIPLGGRFHPLSSLDAEVDLSMPLRVVDHPLEIDDHGGLVADGPGIVPGGQEGHIARFAIQLGAIVHEHAEHAGDMVLEVRGLAAFRLGDGLHAFRPAPAGLEDGPGNGGTADGDQLEPPFGNLADVVRLLEALSLRCC